jgi:hypothetical protein
MLVSALSRDSQKALMVTLALLLLLALGGPISDTIIAARKQRGFDPRWSLSSPAYVLKAAGAWGSSDYWGALAVTHFLGWAMLAGACALVPHTWQERKKAGAGNNQAWAYAWRYGGARRRLRLRRKLIGQQPVAWLVCRERWQSLGLWVLAILLVGGFASVLIGTDATGIWMVWSWIGGLFCLLLYLWAASQACRFPLEARRSGLLELLLATPLTERQIVAGQWRALVRMFGLPVLLLLGVQLATATLSQFGFQRIATRAATMTSSTVTNKNGTVTSQTVSVYGSVALPGKAGTNAAPAPRPMTFPTGSYALQLASGIATAVAAAVRTVANLVALCWFGMWMGMTSRSANLATLKTILFVQIIPWFVMTFLGGMVFALGVSGMMIHRSLNPFGSLAWWPVASALLTAVVVVAKDMIFVIWSRKKLHSSFREEAARSLGQPRFVAPPPLPAAVAAPR